MSGTEESGARDRNALVRRWTRRLLAGAALGTLLRPPDLALAVLAAALGLLALWPEERLSPRLERLAWALVALLVLERIHSPVPLGVVVHAGRAVGVLYVATATIVVFFAAVRALAPRRTPGAAAQALATALALLVALEGGLRLKETGAQDVVMNDVVPLLGSGGGPELLRPGDAPRPDLRGRVFSPRKTPGTFRVALLGGSSAWGHGLDDRALSPAGRIEAHLAERLHGHTAEVLCLAYPGLTSEHELGIVVGQALHWDVDLFLALDAYNDMTVAARRLDEGGFPGTLYLWPQHRSGFRKPLLRWLWQRSLLLRPFTSPRVLLPPPDFQNALTPENANGTWVEALALDEESLCALARDAGARFAWARQPIVYDRTVLGPGDRETYRPPAYAAEVRRRAAQVDAAVPERVRALGGVAVDLAPGIDALGKERARERWFLDECHWTKEGVDAVASELVAALARAGALP